MDNPLHKNAISFDVYKERIETKHIIRGYKVLGYIGKWSGKNTYLSMMCDDHGEWRTGTVASISKGCGCPKCRRITTANKCKTQKSLVLDKINEKCIDKNYEFVKFVDDYNNAYSKIVINCIDHGEWIATYNSFVNGNQKCPCCPRKPILNESDVVNNIIKICTQKNYTFIGWENDKFKDSSSRAIIKCIEHDYQWTTPCSKLISAKQGGSCCADHGYNPNKRSCVYIKLIRNDFDMFVGYGVTRDYVTRMDHHERNLISQNYKTIKQWKTEMIDGFLSKEIEYSVDKNFKHRNDITIKGFVEENSYADQYESIKSHILDLINSSLNNVHNINP